MQPSPARAATMKNALLQPSLRRKVVVGYYAVAALIVVASAFSFGELKSLEDKVVLAERMSELFDATLEVRRFERNYFLHGQEADRAEAGRYVGRVRELLDAHRPVLLAVETPPRLAEFRDLLDRYEAQLPALAAAGADRRQAAALEPRVRALGKEIVAIAEEMAGAERHLVQSSLAHFRTVLILFIGAAVALIVAIGQVLSRSVAAPLKELEASVEAVSAGKRGRLPVRSRDREVVAVIDAFNHMLKELELRQKHLVRSEKLASLGTMLSGVAHELNNPLSNISTSCQILLEELGTADADLHRQLLEQIDEQTGRARNIVRSLLDFAREREFKKEWAPLRPLIEQTVGFVRGEVPAKVSIAIDIPDDIAVFADTQRLQQAFLNLIKNAVEALPGRGSVAVSARKLVATAGAAVGDASCDVAGDAVDILVADDGPGIAPDVLARIFDPFFTTKAVGKGLGLGLFIVYEIVEQHDGCISVDSKRNRGTTFRIRLPAGPLATTDTHT
ncbi:MAG: HAMP domain-containing sensor histidine kinase [Rhodocyclaceae bacterium]|nr:HAMP domain-containing sensor histidine kinase [Rhodocyclaceae bacterium]